MESAARNGKVAVIAAQISYLEATLRRDTVLKSCKPIEKEVARLKTTRFTELRKQAQVVQAKKKLSVCALPVTRTEKIEAALAAGKKGKLAEIAVPDMRDIEREVGACKKGRSSSGRARPRGRRVEHLGRQARAGAPRGARYR